MGYGNRCGPYGFVRRYSTREERVRHLEAYAEALDNELKAVRQRIQEIQPESA